MAENTHHHHHHHHKEDSTSNYKHRTLREQKIKKFLEKWLFRVLCVVAAIMVILVFIVNRLT